MEAKSRVMGYLPNDTPPPGQLVLLGFQHILTMFPATVFVAAFCGFHIGTVLLGSGISTIVALLLSKRGIGKFIPLYYGSSFSYIAAYLGIAQLMTGSLPAFGVPLPDAVIRTMQAGIVVTGLLNIGVGFIVRAVGKAAVDKVLPPVVTGSVAAIIGFGLAYAALGNLASANFLVALITLLVTVLFSVYLQGQGFVGMLPILLGGIVGYVVSAVIDAGSVNMGSVAAAPLLQLPHVTFPTFSGPLVVTAIVSIAIMAIATIPESTAHLYQISLYVDRFAEETGREKLHLDENIGFNLVLDGVGDFLNGLVGATAGTNYGENNSLMAITRNYSGPALIAAGVIAILLAFVGKLAALVGTCAPGGQRRPGDLPLRGDRHAGHRPDAGKQGQHVQPAQPGGRRRHHGGRHRGQHRVQRVHPRHRPGALPQRPARHRHRRGAWHPDQPDLRGVRPAAGCGHGHGGRFGRRLDCPHLHTIEITSTGRAHALPVRAAYTPLAVAPLDRPTAT